MPPEMDPFPNAPISEAVLDIRLGGGGTPWFDDLSFSSQVGAEPSEEYEFESLPLVPTKVVRVKFHHIGPLPPMYLEDEVGTD